MHLRQLLPIRIIGWKGWQITWFKVILNLCVSLSYSLTIWSNKISKPFLFIVSSLYSFFSSFFPFSLNMECLPTWSASWVGSLYPSLARRRPYFKALLALSWNNTFFKTRDLTISLCTGPTKLCSYSCLPNQVCAILLANSWLLHNLSFSPSPTLP